MKTTVMLYSMNITKLSIHDNFREGSNPRVSVFSGVRVTRSLALYVCFVDRCLSFCIFTFGHCVVCSS